jgi:hypothetical protein
MGGFSAPGGTGVVMIQMFRGKSGGGLKLCGKIRAEQNRRVAKGYPIAPRDFTLEEVRAYFSGDKIECLLCGRQLASLAAHLVRIHATSAEDYKRMYGLPWGRGLTSATLSERMSTIAKAIDRPWLEKGSKDRAARMRAAPHRERRRFRDELSIGNVRKINVKKGVFVGYDPDIMTEKLIRHIAQGVTPIEACKRDPDLPHRCYFSPGHIGKDRHARIMQAVWAMPAAYQIRANMGGVSPAIVEEAKALLAKGLSQREVGERLGVSQSAVSLFKQRRLTHEQPQQKGFPQP